MTQTVSTPFVPEIYPPSSTTLSRTRTGTPPSISRPWGLEMWVVLICLRMAREGAFRPPTRSRENPRPPPPGPDAGPESAVFGNLGALFARLATARLRGESAAGMAVAARVQDLLARLPVDAREGVRGLTATLDAHVGALEVNSGHLYEAAARLAHGVELASDVPAYHAARADCAGQLALVEAFRGNLRTATGHAACAMEASDTAPAGAGHGHLAMAWTLLEQGEYAGARQILDGLPCALPGMREPWLTTVHVIAEARLLTAEGRPEAALRLLASAARATGRQGVEGWLMDVTAIATAEALMAVGEPHRVLALVARLPARARAESGVLTASALRDIGDLRGARASLAAVADDVAAAPLQFQVQSWLLEAHLGSGDGSRDRTRLLVDRALRAAGAEGMRRPLANDRVWLSAFVERDLSLKRDHRDFLSSLRGERRPESPMRREASRLSEDLVEPLTGREMDVLELLAEMYATDEIAHALHLSVNTVKTHIKGVFRKLSVNRRTAAVRRGRALGLC
jgi:LuxR family maltose regulon positive regulatory protein